jgi:hypothetical protein
LAEEAVVLGFRPVLVEVLGDYYINLYLLIA